MHQSAPVYFPNARIVNLQNEEEKDIQGNTHNSILEYFFFSYIMYLISSFLLKAWELPREQHERVPICV